MYTCECQICSKEFKVNRKKSRFCSPNCRSKDFRKNSKTYYTNKYGTPYKAKTYCVCYVKECISCLKIFVSKRKDTKVCTPRCKKSKPLVSKQCVFCSKNFFGGKNKKYCSRKCSKRKYRSNKTSEPIENTCKKCGKITHTKSYNKQYCSKSCRPRNKTTLKRHKKLRRAVCKKAKLSIVKWSEIDRFYENRPLEYEVDHIIPLNHELVCGLHIPNNFQYLTREENIFKSNKFDGTNENESWKL